MEDQRKKQGKKHVYAFDTRGMELKKQYEPCQWKRNTAVLHSISRPLFFNRKKSASENRENTTVSAAMLWPAVCVSDIIEKLACIIKIKIISYATRLFLFFDSERKYLPHEELRFEAKKVLILQNPLLKDGTCRLKYLHISTFSSQPVSSLRLRFKNGQKATRRELYEATSPRYRSLPVGVLQKSDQECKTQTCLLFPSLACETQYAWERPSPPPLPLHTHTTTSEKVLESVGLESLLLELLYKRLRTMPTGSCLEAPLAH